MQLTTEDKERIEREALEALWEKMSREDWLAGEGFSGKFDGLSRVPFIFKKRIFEFAAEYATIYEREKQAEGTIFLKVYKHNEQLQRDINLLLEMGVAKEKKWETERSDLLAKVSEQEKEILKLRAENEHMKNLLKRYADNE